ncbi:cilia- and flagella-associated protein 119 isoform 1-T1 [Synchiropus picturatus]
MAESTEPLSVSSVDVDSNLMVPQVLKAKIMLWTDVSYKDMEELEKLQSVPDLESALCRLFEINIPEPKREILLELYVQTVQFCRQHDFKKEQTSAMLSIVKHIHKANTETPLNNIEQCFEYSQELILCHSIRRPPFSINLFSLKEATSILEYIHSNYIRHYKLYKHIFTPEVSLDLRPSYSGIPKEEEEEEAAMDNICC